ncbi:LysR family transcriptional regulator [Desulfospira joergensenii]|uniref:LysR family transcriptional regulator n=1 Tax=Desulfospira joergensenii TaxID=53329 RepID=UPI0003B3C4C8|nr:LysR family transcriptional regulator [Desulfospira joergensenii]
MNLMNIDHLKSFFMVAKIGNFTKAARALFLTQPAVSQHIQALEHFYDTVLFDRTGKKIMLTRQGEILFEQTEELLAKFQEVETIFMGMNNMSRGRLDIASSAVISAYMLPKIIGKYHGTYPDIELNLRGGNTHKTTIMVLEGQVDFGFATGPPSRYPEVEAVGVHHEEMIAVVAGDSPLAKKNLISISDLKRIPFITREHGTQTRQFVSTWFSEYKTDKSDLKFIELENVESAKRIAEEGFGITVIPESAVKRELASGRLARVNLKGFRGDATFYLLYHKARKLSVVAKAFLSMLSEAFDCEDTLTSKLNIPAR